MNLFFLLYLDIFGPPETVPIKGVQRVTDAKGAGSSNIFGADSGDQVKSSTRRMQPTGGQSSISFGDDGTKNEPDVRRASGRMRLGHNVTDSNDIFSADTQQDRPKSGNTLIDRDHVCDAFAVAMSSR